MFRKTAIAVLSLMCFLCTSVSCASEPNDYIVPGRASMFNGTVSGLQEAYQIFNDGLNDTGCSDCNTNRELIFLHALSRITMWGAKDDGEPIDSAIELAREFGVEVLGDYFYELDVNYPNDVELPKNQHDAYVIPEETPDIINGICEFLGTSAITEVNAVLEELNSIGDAPDNRFRVFFDPNETHMFFGPSSPKLHHDVEVDYAEVMILKGMLTGFKGLLRTQMAYDLYVDENDMLIEKIYGDSFNVNSDLLNPHPDFLNVLPTANDSNDGAAILAQAAHDWIDTINSYLDMINYVRSEEDSQDDDLLCIDPNDDDLVNKINDRLTTLRDSLIDDTVATVPLETTKTYTLEETSSPSTWELKLVFYIIGLDAGGSFALVTGSGLPSPWEITSFAIEGNVLTAEMDYDVPGDWGGAWLEADISQDCNTITNGIFEYWGPSSGTISNLSGQIINIDIEEGNLDLNPIFGGSQRYPTPVNPRDLLPEFDEWNGPQPDTVGHGLGDDATLGGIAPDMNQYDWQVLCNLQPAGLFYLDFINPWQVTVDGNVNDWSAAQLVFTDISQDTKKDSNDVNGVDIQNLYMAYDWENVYGAITFYDAVFDPNQPRLYALTMSYSPDNTSTLDSLKLESYTDETSSYGHLYHMTYDEWGWMWWHDIADLDFAVGESAVEFKIPFVDIPTYLSGRFISIESSGWDPSWYEYDGEKNTTHLKIGEVGSIGGTITYDYYKGDPIFIHAYTDPEDPDGSIVASTMITEPGPYTLDGIGLGWRGFVRAFTPLFGFDNPFELVAFDIQTVTPVFLMDTHLDGVDLVLNYPTILEKDIWEPGEIDADTREVDWYFFDAVQGGTYTLDLTRGTADYACMALYGRDGDTELIKLYDWQTQQINWPCPVSGRYYIKVANGYYQPAGGTYQIRMTSDLTCPQTDIACAEWVGVKDCKVDSYDLSALVSRWLNSCSSPYWCDDCDFNESGLVDFTDFANMANEWMVDGNP